MFKLLEEYALLGDCETAALVARDGSIDWLCFPRFDSAACFAALLGDQNHGHWTIAPAGGVRSIQRRYLGDTLVLETVFSSADGEVALIDFMPVRDGAAGLVRILEGRSGRVPIECILRVRFDYGSLVPWVRREPSGIIATAGPDAVHLRTTVPLEGENLSTVARFEIEPGQRVPFALIWHPSFEPPPPPIDAEASLEATLRFWKAWSARSTYRGTAREAVMRSLLTLKALTYAPTGGIVAAPTTSLPEQLGGARNWDYRYCWLRDATFTLYALIGAGYLKEAEAWREWLLRAVAGAPDKLHIMYGIAGERRLPELELAWLPGYENSSPVRIGNGAYRQLQLDVYGEVLDATYRGWRMKIAPPSDEWALERALIESLEQLWEQPDEGIWEVRGPRRHFTHSKLMAWVALDRAVKGIEHYGLEGPLERWRALRRQIFENVCREGYSSRRNAFVQYYGSDELDASLLMLPLVGFLPPSDARVRGTVEAIERELVSDGFVSRYKTRQEVDGLPPGEGAFLLCTFWLVDNLVLLGRHADARRIFDGALAVRNDVGLLSESFDVKARRLVGNYPQAFSHIGLINAAQHLSGWRAPAGQRWDD